MQNKSNNPKNENKSNNPKDQTFEMLHFLVCWQGGFAYCNVVAEKTIVKSLETQIKTHSTKAMF
jgi:hypothetical protein